MKLSSTHLSMCFMCLLAAFMIAVPDVAFASGGAEAKVMAFFSRIENIFRTISISVITVALMWAGYKVGWTEAGIRDVSKPVMAAFIIGCAAEFARFLLT
ncbi:TrbC/VirB2 family protein [Photobacterium damselae]|nr:TrbC/VirB2 family protein [Photobacterium damselae]